MAWFLDSWKHSFHSPNALKCNRKEETRMSSGHNHHLLLLKIAYAFFIKFDAKENPLKCARQEISVSRGKKEEFLQWNRYV